MSPELSYYLATAHTAELRRQAQQQRRTNDPRDRRPWPPAALRRIAHHISQPGTPRRPRHPSPAVDASIHNARADNQTAFRRLAAHDGNPIPAVETMVSNELKPALAAKK